MVKYLFVFFLWVVIVFEVGGLASGNRARPTKLTVSLRMRFSYWSALFATIWSDFPLHGKFMVIHLNDIYDHNFRRWARPDKGTSDQSKICMFDKFPDQTCIWACDVVYHFQAWNFAVVNNVSF